MVNLRRIALTDAHMYTWAMEQLAEAFPPEERRDDYLQRKVLGHPDYRLCAIVHKSEPVGVVGYWETPDFIYFENFCVEMSRRNRGFGSATLQHLTSQGKTFILEIELPVDRLTQRRKAFYLRNGMVENPYPHIQPHYRATDPDLPLMVLTYRTPLTPHQYGDFRRYLDENVDVKTCWH